MFLYWLSGSTDDGNSTGAPVSSRWLTKSYMQDRSVSLPRIALCQLSCGVVQSLPCNSLRSDLTPRADNLSAATIRDITNVEKGVWRVTRMCFSIFWFSSWRHSLELLPRKCRKEPIHRLPTEFGIKMVNSDFIPRNALPPESTDAKHEWRLLFTSACICQHSCTQRIQTLE